MSSLPPSSTVTRVTWSEPVPTLLESQGNRTEKSRKRREDLRSSNYASTSLFINPHFHMIFPLPIHPPISPSYLSFPFGNPSLPVPDPSLSIFLTLFPYPILRSFPFPSEIPLSPSHILLSLSAYPGPSQILRFLPTRSFPPSPPT